MVSWRGMLKRATLAVPAVLLLRSAAMGGDPVLFTKRVMTDVKPTDAPGTGKIVKSIELIACPGEFEPFSLAIRGSEEGSWKFLVSDLRASDGAVIPASAVEVAMMWWEQTHGHLNKYTTVTDWIPDPARGVAVEKDRTAWVWLTVHVPEKAKAGLYEGSFALKEARGAEVKVPLAVDVLPVDLKPVPGVQFALLSTVGFGQYHTAKSRVQLKPAALAFYRELKDHGMTVIAEKCSDWDGPTYRKTGSGYRAGHFEGLEACIDASREAGFTGPVIWYMSSLINGVKGGRMFAQYDGKCDNFNEARDLAILREIVTEVQKRRQEKNWPEIIFRTVDEPGTQTEDRRIRALRLGTILPKSLKVVHDLGARGATTMSEPVDNKHNKRWVKEPDELRKQWDLSRPYCHVRIYAYGYPQGKTSLWREKADCERRGHEMWFYHNKAIMGRDRSCARLYFGLWGWKVSAKGITAWTYPGGRSLQFEVVREGIDDFRYVATLERLIREKRGSEANRRSAQDFLDSVKAAIKLNSDGYVTNWSEAALAVTRAAAPDANPTAPDFAALKRRLAAHIKRLSGAT